jgi:hypothetical protein
LRHHPPRGVSGKQEYARFIPQDDGTILLQVTGSFRVTITDMATGNAVEGINASGPLRSLIYPNDDFEFIAHGLNLFFFSDDQAAQLGLPAVFVSSGLVDYLFHSDGTAEIIRRGSIHTDVWAELVG